MKPLLLALAASLEIIYVSAIPSAARSSQICGKAGYDAGIESFWGSSIASYVACSKACSRRTQCQSFAYGAGDCQLYECSVKSNFVAVSDSPYLFYDSSCIVASASTTTTISTTTKAKMTTSTSSTKVPTTTTKQTTTTTTTAKLTTTTTTTKLTSTSTKTTTTKKITSTTTTTTTAASSATSGLVCGQQGYMQGSSGFHGYTDTYATTQEALDACYNNCLTNTESYCTAWEYSPGSYDPCVLYSYAVEDHFIATSDAGSYIWDRRCGQPVDTVD